MIKDNIKSLSDYREETKLELTKRKLMKDLYEKKLQLESEQSDKIKIGLDFKDPDVIDKLPLLNTFKDYLEFISWSNDRKNLNALKISLYQLREFILTNQQILTSLDFENDLNKVYVLIDYAGDYIKNDLIVKEILFLINAAFYFLKNNHLSEILFSDKLISVLETLLISSYSTRLICLQIIGNALNCSNIRKLFLVSTLYKYIINILNLNEELNIELIKLIAWIFYRMLIIKPELTVDNVRQFILIFNI